MPPVALAAEDIAALCEARHPDPFAVLGPQPLPSGSWVVRVWMPEAERVELLVDGQIGRAHV